jgi:hypothetical protein
VDIANDAKAIRLSSVRVPVVTFVNDHFAGYAHETIAADNREFVT